MVFRCPVCRGHIALWAMQSVFTCHHCQWALSSNIRSACVKAVGAAMVAETVLLLVLLSWLQPSAGLGAWLAAGGVLGFAVGWLAFKSLVLLQPMRPQAKARPNQSFHRTASGGR